MGLSWFIFWFTIMWIESEEPVLCTDLALRDVSTPYSSSRFLWGQPSASCSCLPEGLFSRVWSQSKRSNVEQCSCNHRPSSQRGSLTHRRQQSTAHKYPTHSRDCKIIWIFFLKKTWLSFLLYFLIWCTWLINIPSSLTTAWMISTAAASSPPTGYF